MKRGTSILDQPSIVVWGCGVCLWFGMCLCIEPYYNIAPGLFLHLSKAESLITGVMLIIVGLMGLFLPPTFALTATLAMGGLRSFQALISHNFFPLGLWLFAVVLAVYYSGRQERHRAPPEHDHSG